MLVRLYAKIVQGLLYLMGDRPQTIEAEGFGVRLHRLGPQAGEPWLLLHGLGSTAFSWLAVIRELRRECRLLFPELSSLGGTSGPRPALGPRDGPAVLCSLLDRQDLRGPVTVAGISMGGWIAVRLALDAPDHVGRLLLLNAAGWVHQDWEEIRRKVLLESLADVDPFYRILFRRTPWRFRLSKPGVLEAFRSPAVRSLLDSLEERDLYGEEDLAGLRVPTGIVWAGCDGLFSVDTAWEIARSLADLRYFSVIPDCGHALHWDRPDEVVRRVREFRKWVGVRG